MIKFTYSIGNNRSNNEIRGIMTSTGTTLLTYK